MVSNLNANLPTRPVCKHYVAFFIASLNERHTGTFFPVPHCLLEHCPLTAWNQWLERKTKSILFHTNGIKAKSAGIDGSKTQPNMECKQSSSHAQREPFLNLLLAIALFIVGIK